MALMEINNVSIPGRLQSVDLQLFTGEVVGLIGPNGAGKSSLLSAIAGLLEYAGDIEFKGENIKHYSAQQKARFIALQPQFIESAWALSVHDVVSMGRIPWGDSDQQIIQTAMCEAQVDQLAQRHVDELSGGEKARVWLARVLANQAELLLVDEPVANLDIHYQRDVMQLLRAEAEKGQSVLIALHDLSLAAKYCDRLCLLDQNRVVKIGKVNEVLSEDILSEVFGLSVFVDLDANPPVVLPR